MPLFYNWLWAYSRAVTVRSVVFNQKKKQYNDLVFILFLYNALRGQQISQVGPILSSLHPDINIPYWSVLSDLSTVCFMIKTCLNGLAYYIVQLNTEI